MSVAVARRLLQVAALVLIAFTLLGWTRADARTGSVVVSLQSAPPTPSQTNGAATPTASSSSASDTSTTDWPWLALAALAVGLVATGVVLFFVRRESESSQETIRGALALGRTYSHRA